MQHAQEGIAALGMQCRTHQSHTADRLSGARRIEPEHDALRLDRGPAWLCAILNVQVCAGVTVAHLSFVHPVGGRGKEDVGMDCIGGIPKRGSGRCTAPTRTPPALMARSRPCVMVAAQLAAVEVARAPQLPQTNRLDADLNLCGEPALAFVVDRRAVGRAKRPAGRGTRDEPTGVRTKKAPTEKVEAFWSGRRDLNSRLQPWQGCTLPLSYSRSGVGLSAPPSW